MTVELYGTNNNAHVHVMSATYSVPKFRVDRQHSASSVTASSSATIPVHHLRPPDTLATLSSETEHEGVGLPTRRLRNVMALMATHNLREPSPARKALSAPSIRDSDLDSVTSFALNDPSTSVKGSLRDVFEKALERPVGHTPVKAKRRGSLEGLHSRRRSVSDDDLSGKHTPALLHDLQSHNYTSY